MSDFSPGKLHTSGTLGDTLEPFNPADPSLGYVAEDTSVPTDRLSIDSSPVTADKIVAVRCEPRRMCELQFRVGRATDPNNTINYFAVHGVNAMPNKTGNQRDGNRWVFQRRLLLTCTATCGNTEVTANQLDALITAQGQIDYPVWKSVDTITIGSDYTRDGASVLYSGGDGLAVIQFDHGSHQYIEIELQSASDTGIMAEYRFLSH